MRYFLFCIFGTLLFADSLPECKSVANKEKGCIEKKTFFDEDAKEEVTSEAIFKNSKKQGVEKTFYKNGKIFSEKKYRDDLLHGVSKVYYKNGKLKDEVKFDRGIPMLANFFYKNGKLKEILQTECKNDQECITKVTNVRDDSYTERKVVRGENSIVWDNKIQRFYGDGGLHEIVIYKDDQLSHYTSFYPNGDLAQEIEYKKDGVIYVKQYDRKGSPLLEYKENLKNDEFLGGQCANGKKLTIAHYLRIKKAKGIAYSVCQ